MMPPLVFAQKLHIPVQDSCTRESLNMLAALARLGTNLHALIGISGNKQKQIERLQEEQAIPSAGIRQCQFFPAWPDGLYSALLRRILRTHFAEAPEAFFFTFTPELIAYLQAVGKTATSTPRIIYELHEHRADNPAQEQQGIDETLQALTPAMLEPLAGCIVPNTLLKQKLEQQSENLPPLCVEPLGYAPECFPVISGPSSLGQRHSNAVRVVCMGSLHTGMGIDNLIKAFHILPSNFSLTIVGSEAAQQLGQYRELMADLGDRVTLTDTVTPYRVSTLIAKAHIAVFPQSAGDAWYSCPALYEAMSLGLPLLLTPLPLFDGLLLQDEQVHRSPDIAPEGIAHGIKELAAQPAYALSMREHNLQKVQYYSWQERALRIINFLRTLKA